MDTILAMVAFVAFAVMASEKDIDIAQEITIVRGQNAILPCGSDIDDVLRHGDTVNWYKDDYPFENRSAGEKSTLVLREVRTQDAGRYRCRVCSDDGPSMELTYELNIIDVHGPPKIMFASNASLLTETSIGPFEQGSELSLHCVVEDSHPSTTVGWFRNDEAMLRARRGHDGLCRAELTITNMTRNHHGVKYECRADTQNVTKSAGFMLQMTLPPLNVSIRTDNKDDFESGTPRVVACIVYGCVPAPSVAWYLGDTMLRPNLYKEVNRGNFTVSSLTFVPSLSDNGKELVCKVTNDRLAQTFEDKVIVSVGQRPMCIDSGYKTIGAIEGDSETVVCAVESFPPPDQFVWTFADSRSIYTSSKKVDGYDGRYSSTLSWVARRDDFGPLYCRASNRFGEQRRPCTFSVINGGPPTTPECHMFWKDRETLKVRCDKNWDGGRPRAIHVEVKSKEKILKVTNGNREVEVDHLYSGTNITAEVYASNSRGRSPSVSLMLAADPHVKPADPRAAIASPSSSVTEYSWVGLAAVSAGGLLVVALLGLLGFYIVLTCNKYHPTPATHVTYKSKKDEELDAVPPSSAPSVPSKCISYRCGVALQFEENLDECRYVSEPYAECSASDAPESSLCGRGHGGGDRYEFCV